MTLPAPHTISVRRQVTVGEPNPFGYVEVGYSDPELVPVHGYAPGPSVEAMAAGRTSTEVAWTVYAPAGTNISAHDFVTLHDGVEYEVDGPARDYTFAPWTVNIAGVTFELKHKEG